MLHNIMEKRILRDCGYVGKCTAVSIVVVCSNIVLNAVFIYGYFGFPRMEIAGGGGFTMYSVILGHLGSDAVAANSIANITKNLLICVCTGFGYGGSIIIGNLLGKGNLSEAQKNGNILCRIAVFSGRGRYKIRIEVRCGYHVVFCGSIGISGGICMEAAGADGIFCIKS